MACASLLDLPACLQEHLLHLLLQPRQRYTEMDELEEEEEEDQAGCKGDEGNDVTRSHSGEQTGRGRDWAGVGRSLSVLPAYMPC